MTIVGLVRSVKESSTRIDYEIDDMSGPLLEVKQFVDNDVSERYFSKPVYRNTCNWKTQKVCLKVTFWNITQHFILMA